MALVSANVDFFAFGNEQSQDSKKSQEGSKDDKKSTEKPKSDEKIYEVGGDVKAPKLTHYVEPEFSSSSKEAFVDGVVKIETVVTTEGLPTKLKIVSGLNTEEDKTAMEAVKEWRFRPGTKGDTPVNVKVTVELDFHLL
ncbi:MAG TPA: energy transducer TonB [Bryobacteraceae bacterium]|jgi:TonB family protein|nr:energy transducer TonB [Bryobacteraceae bacterium]